MQKLGERNTYTPTNASQVRSSVVVSLNREETLGEHDLKTCPNNLDGNQLSGKREQDLRVPVLNMRGKPLMPARPAKVRHLLKEGKAMVVGRSPFTIQLTTATGEAKQDIALGVDCGYSHVGLSAVSRRSGLFSAEVILRGDIVKLNSERRQYRRARRSRLWHRQPRFDNRKKDKGWLAPSIQHKLDSYFKLIGKIKEILPIAKINVEVAAFDIAKIKNPDIEGEGYQNGVQKNFWNTREYVLFRDNHTCQACKGKSKDPVLEVHHLESRKTGGDRPDNLIALCNTCHSKVSKGKFYLNVKIPKGFKAETFMNTVRWKLVNRLKELGNSVSHTYGYITKSKRIEIGLEKNHVNDAFVIAGGTTQERCSSFTVSQARRNNRRLQTNRKGYRPSIRRKRYELQPNDLVRYDNTEKRVKGVFNYGTWVRLDDGVNTNVKNVEVLKYGKGIQFV